MDDSELHAQALHDDRMAGEAKRRAEIAALQRTVETLGADVLRLAGENDALCRALARYAEGQANDEKRIDGLRALLKRMGIDDPSGAMALFRIDDEVAAGIAAPSQPEPVKAHAFVFDGFHAITRWCRVCSNPDGPPWHAPTKVVDIGSTMTTHFDSPLPVVPENAGTTCGACKGLKGFDTHGNPSADHVGRYCGICAGTGRAK